MRGGDQLGTKVKWESHSKLEVPVAVSIVRSRQVTEVKRKKFRILDPLGFEGAQHRQTLRPSSRRDPQQSRVSFRIAVMDLEDPAVRARTVQMARSE